MAEGNDERSRMSAPVPDDMEAAVASMREQLEKVGQAIGEVENISESATSKDRMVTATVDARGRLTDLALNGRRWRDLAPKELCARVVETVESAREAATGKTTQLMTGLLPPGLDAVFDGSAKDFDSMRAALRDLGKDDHV